MENEGKGRDDRLAPGFFPSTLSHPPSTSLNGPGDADGVGPAFVAGGGDDVVAEEGGGAGGGEAGEGEEISGSLPEI